jgi:streptogramin lyase
MATAENTPILRPVMTAAAHLLLAHVPCHPDRDFFHPWRLPEFDPQCLTLKCQQRGRVWSANPTAQCTIAQRFIKSSTKAFCATSAL